MELFGLLGDGVSADGNGSTDADTAAGAGAGADADADADAITIGYDEFCDLLNRLNPAWEEDQLDDALMALVGELEQPLELAALPAASARHLSLEHTHSDQNGGGGGIHSVGGGGSGGAAADGGSDAWSRLAAGRKLASAFASRAFGGAVEGAPATWAEGHAIDVFVLLERETKALLPMAHLTVVGATLSNLRSAGFDVAEGNVLLRALYSWGDELNGGAMRQAAWRLLSERHAHLRRAADKLADEVSEAPRSGVPHDGTPPTRP